MFNYLAMGHFDKSEIEDRKIVVLRPLDSQIVKDLLKEMATPVASGSFTVDGHPFVLNPGGVVSCLSPVIKNGPFAFVLRLAKKAQCDIADLQIGLVMSPESFVEHTNELRKLVDQEQEQTE